MTCALMSSPRGVPLLGDQEPRVCSLPPFDSDTSGRNAVTLAGVAGLELDPWQQLVLESGLRRRDGKWAAFEVALIVARQNGKGTVLEALELAALFLFPDVRLILHSAHEFKTAAEAFLRVRALIEDNPDFDSQVSRIRTAAGAEAVELKDGKRLRFVARSSGSGRGFTSDLVILDEAYDISEDSMASMLPTLSTRPNPQVWYTSTAGGQDSVQLARVRDRGLRGGDESLAFLEWSVDPVSYDPADPRCWGRCTSRKLRRRAGAGGWWDYFSSTSCSEFCWRIFPTSSCSRAFSASASAVCSPPGGAISSSGFRFSSSR